MSLDIIREARWLGRPRVQAYSRLLAFALLPTLWLYYQRAMGPLGSDFLNFWVAAKLTTAGTPALAYDPATMSGIQLALGRDHWFPFISPPPMLGVIAPFGLLPYAWALPAFVASTFVIWLVVARQLLPGGTWAIAAFPGAAVAAWHAQTGFITAALLIGGLLVLRRRPFAAGLLFGCLVIKPHLALFIPLALLAAREWRCIAGASVSSLGLLAISLVAFGPEAFRAYSEAAPLMTDLLANGLQSGIPGTFLRMSTAYGFLRVLGVSPAVACILQLGLTAALALIVWRTWSRRQAWLERGGVLILATALGTPYLFAYDLAMLIVPVCFLWRRGAEHGFAPWDKAWLALLYATPLVGRALAEPLGINLTAPLLLLTLTTTVLGLGRGGSPMEQQALSASA
jgi:hypothetical protein